VTLPRTGLPTTLGTSVGNARLESVELIVEHSYNADIEISLTSPAGTTLALITDKGGSGDDLGNTGTCPASPLILRQGAPTPLPTGNTNITGTYAPQSAFTGFTGDPNGDWVLNVCDDAGADVGTLVYVQLNFCTVAAPTVSNTISVGTNPTCDGSSVTFSATPTTGGSSPTYQWQKNGVNISGETAVTYTGIAGTDFVNGDLIRVVMTSSSLCATSATATSSAITMTVVAPPSASAAGGDQSTCTVPGSATMAGNTPGVGTGTWSQIAGPITASITTPGSPTTGITGMTTPGTYTFRWTIANSPCTSTTDDVDVVVGVCTYYSRADGNVGDAIWSDTPTGTAGSATFTATTSMVIQSSDVVALNANTTINDLTVDAGGQLDLGAYTLTVSGDLFDVNGAFTAADNSLILFNSTALTTLESTPALSLYDLTANTPGDMLVDATINIRGTLLLQDGDFDASIATITLGSNASGTGRLGPVAASASYTGDLTMQRYIPAGATNWRMMGSPVGGQTVNNWKDDFYTAGFPGSHSPNFASPVGSGILWPSVRWYDETDTGAGVNDGLTGATSTSQALTAGQGFAAWCGTGLNTTTAFTVDVTGAPNVAASPITLPMSHTNTGVPATDGWNMVSNPLPSPILFSNISRGTDVEDFITYFDPATGNNATYDIGLGVGTNGGTNTIQSSQGFWLKTTGTGVTTTVEEADKVASNSGGFFGGDQVQTASMIRLRIGTAMNQYSDEAVLLFSSGEPAFNSNDVPKFIFAHPDAPQIASVGAGGELIAINAYGQYSDDISIPVTVDVAVNGQYSIVATGLHNIGLSCVRLEDLATGTITPLTEGATYTFTALASDDVDEPRFLLHASAPVQLNATDATCHGRDDGSASALITAGPVDLVWSDANGVVMLEQNNVMPGTADLMALEAGTYTVSIAGVPTCSGISTTFTIEEPTALEAEAVTLPSTCPESLDGSIDLTVLGGVAPYQFQWSNEADAEDLVVGAGTYTVLITDAHGCTFAPQAYEVGHGEGPDAGISLESTLVNVGEEVLFAPNTLEGVTNNWDFGDGHQSSDLEPVHSFEQPGTYTVTLVVDDGSCTSTATVEVQVQTSTAIISHVGKDLNAYVSGDRIVVDHDFGTKDPVIIRIYSSGGQLVQEYRMSNAPARISLPTNDLADGIWLVRVSSGDTMRTFSLPVLH